MLNILIKVFTLILFYQTTITFAEGLILCNAPGRQLFPVVISDGTGGAVFAWEDGRNGEDLDIYMQRVDASGNIVWQKNGIPICQKSYNQTDVRIVSSIDSVIVLWLDNRSGESWEVYAQLVNLEGKTLWQKDGVLIGGSIENAISDGYGGSITVWQAYHGESIDIFAQRFNRKGELLWQKGGLVISKPDSYQRDPVLTSDGNGGAIIAWWDNVNNTNWHIYAQHVNADGVLLWDNHLMVSPKKGIQGEPRIVSDNEGGAIVIWQKYENLRSSGVFAQRIDGNGRKLWNEEGVPLCEAPETQRHPAAVSDGHGGAVVVWCDNRDVFSDLYIQHISANGKTSWQKDGNPFCVAPGIQDAPFIIGDRSGNIFVFWNDYREDYGNDLVKDLYAQKIDLRGNILWQPDGVKICNLKNSLNLPISAPDETGGAFTVWSDGIEDTSNIYFQRISSDSFLNKISQE